MSSTYSSMGQKTLESAVDSNYGSGERVKALGEQLVQELTAAAGAARDSEGALEPMSSYVRYHITDRTPYPCPLPEEPKAHAQLLEEHPDLNTVDGVVDNVMSVYTMVLHAEAEAAEPLDVIRSRLVGYFILYSPTMESLVATAEELRSIQAEQSAGPARSFNSCCYQLGDELLEHFVRPFHKRRCDRSTRFGDAPPKKLTLPEMAEDAPRNPVNARLAALIRDCFRCQVTDTIDLDSVIHIESNNETQWRFWERFGHPELRAELAQTIHRPENVVTFRSDICEMMDDLRFCSKPVNGRKSTFDCVMFGPDADRMNHACGIPERRTFMFHRANTMPTPEVKYLRILATCCFIANLSGALEYNEELTRVVMTGSERCTAPQLS
ncbi:hypothetical protein C8T65DRAFT_698266 [Cerioporus squamosus]|nr:hypothetical protein C8T65DRAFT_698266 [Cerioporus squamosus]